MEIEGEIGKMNEIQPVDLSIANFRQQVLDDIGSIYHEYY